MPEEKAVLPPDYRNKADALRKAFEEYLSDLKLLRSERDEIVRRFMERVEGGKIEDVRKMIDEL